MLHVVRRLQVADESHLAQERGELAGLRLPVDALGAVQDRRRLFARAAAEVGQQARAHTHRLAHVQERAAAVVHAVHAGPVLDARADLGAQAPQAPTEGGAGGGFVEQARPLGARLGGAGPHR